MRLYYSRKEYRLILYTILFILLVLYYLSPEQLSRPWILTAFVLFSIFALIRYLMHVKEKKSTYSYLNHIVIFFLLSFVVTLQFPLDYVLVNTDLDYSFYFYSSKTITKSIYFSFLTLCSFLLGTTYWKEISISSNCYSKGIKTKPFLYLSLICWFLFVLTINEDFLDNGHGIVAPNGFSISMYGFYIRFAMIYIGLSVYNAKLKRNSSFFKSLSPIFVLSILISAYMFLSAHNRLFMLTVCVPLLFAFIIIKKWTLSLGQLIFMLFVAAVFMTFFKMYDLQTLGNEISLNVEDVSSLNRLKSYSPFTSELAASIFSHTVLFDMWYNGTFLYGQTIIMGLLKVFPGVVPMLFAVLNLDYMYTQSASFATQQIGAGYGIGSTAQADLLISVGLIMSVIGFGLLGKFCKKCNQIFVLERVSPILYVVSFSLATQIMFLPRAVFSDVISIIVFNYLVTKYYLRL